MFGVCLSLCPRAQVVRGSWPRSMSLDKAVKSLTDPKCVIDQQCHLAFLLHLPCFASSHTAQPLFQHKDSIRCILYDSIDEFVNRIVEQFESDVVSPARQRDADGMLATGSGGGGGIGIGIDIGADASTIPMSAAGSSATPTPTSKPPIKLIIKRAKVMKLLTTWISQRGGQTDLTNHQVGTLLPYGTGVSRSWSSSCTLCIVKF